LSENRDEVRGGRFNRNTSSPFASISFMPGSDPSSAADRDDVQLMELIGGGDMAAFEQLVERHQALVLGTIGRMLGDNADVEDIGQQVFVRVWKSAKRYKPQAKFTTWLLKITRNLVFNELRRRKRHAATPLQSDASGEEMQIADAHEQTPDATLLEHELQRAIDAAISALPESQRMAVVLRRYQELSYEEIADVLKQSVPAVKSLLFRARTELRQRLKNYLAGN
jgi:RNA polymerase sigma-70 factor (ECF subfamily)